jgi:hypothetical protein
MNDDAKALAEQYADAENLRARIRLHEGYSTAAESWWPWVFDRVREAADAAGAGEDADALADGPLDVHTEQGAFVARVAP